MNDYPKQAYPGVCSENRGTPDTMPGLVEPLKPDKETIRRLLGRFELRKQVCECLTPFISSVKLLTLHVDHLVVIPESTHL